MISIKNEQEIELMRKSGDITYGALMGLLKNYEIMNPFISSTHDSLKRLKPGYEAPVCIVTSLGNDAKIPSRNRTVLISLIKDINNKMATRFELRSPNPKTNIYLATAVSYMAMLDGIKYAIKNNKTEDSMNVLAKMTRFSRAILYFSVILLVAQIVSMICVDTDIAVGHLAFQIFENLLMIAVVLL